MYISSKFLLTQMFVPADWQTAKNHITRSYLFMYVNIYKCGNMVVSKTTWMVHEGFNPQIARTFCCLMFVLKLSFSLCSMIYVSKIPQTSPEPCFLVFSPRKPGGWESALVSITLLGWPVFFGGEVGDGHGSSFHPKVKGNVTGDWEGIFLLDCFRCEGCRM